MRLCAAKRIITTLYRHLHSTKMAKSRYEYVKTFELEDKIIPNCWIVVRVDGKGFHKFSEAHDFEKPNDLQALNLMNQAAVSVMEEFRDVVLSYGQSDEYSFVFRKNTNVYNRRSAKLLSYVTSIFTSSYVFHWSSYFPHKQLKYPPCFDGRTVLYPSDENLRDYLSWRQADVHINNLYNTAFWSLVLKSGFTRQDAEKELRGTFSADKNELLFSKFGINYNNLPAIFRKGTTLLRKYVNLENSKARLCIVPFHDDMIRNQFWNEHKEILENKSPSTVTVPLNSWESSTSELVERQFEKMSVNK